MQLIDLVEILPARFVKLDDGRFLALTEEARQRIEELSLCGDRRVKQKKLRFPPVRATAFEALWEFVKLKSDKHCKEWLRSMRDATDIADEVLSTLKQHLFGPGDWTAMLNKLGILDLVICTYGLLHTEAKQIKAVSWHTLILDEVQMIKNMDTQRSRASMGSRADFRMIITGTPLENHLEELWNLFEFINPGLLGSGR